MSASKFLAIADAAHALARVALEIAKDEEQAADTLLRIDEAARLAATSKRVLREAIRRGEIAAYGRERDRAVRRADLDAWIKNRRVEFQGPEDADMDRRLRRLTSRARSRIGP